ncbi:MAG: hypothetical protein ABJ251_10955 [Paracoccaceae bacterium]
MFVVGAGWVHADELVEGDHIRNADLHELTVLSIEADTRPQIVHNLEITNAHTYFAGELEAWGHNQRRIGRPDPNAVGTHSTLKSLPCKGGGSRIISGTTLVPQGNPRNPNPWKVAARYDFDSNSAAHFDKKSGQTVRAPHKKVNGVTTPLKGKNE